VQFERQGQPLLAGHAPVMLNLFGQCRFRCHNLSIIKSDANYNFKSASVTAPREALVTALAYLARTPRV
jgi:hypothetical protein